MAHDRSTSADDRPTVTRRRPRAPLAPLAPLALVLAVAISARAAGAQMVGVPVPPRRPVAPTAVAARADSGRGSATPRDTVDERQRLDIQAWVDSAAPALARAPRPAPAVTTPVTPAERPPVPVVRPAASPAAPVAPARRAPRRPSQEARTGGTPPSERRD